jgi:hypothetical protein
MKNTKILFCFFAPILWSALSLASDDVKVSTAPENPIVIDSSAKVNNRSLTPSWMTFVPKIDNQSDDDILFSSLTCIAEGSNGVLRSESWNFSKPFLVQAKKVVTDVRGITYMGGLEGKPMVTSYVSKVVCSIFGSYNDLTGKTVSIQIPFKFETR